MSTRQTLKRLEMRLRAVTPVWMRRLYRATRAFNPAELSKSLPEDLVRDCRFCVSRNDMVARLPQGGIVAELGTWRGAFAREILDRSDPRELHVVDIDLSQFGEPLAADPRVKRHQGLAHEVIASFPDGYFDWVYVDAGHAYSEVIRDARAAAPKIKAGGYLVFNDFAHVDVHLGRYGVHRAAVDFALEFRWPLQLFAFSPDALYDIALQRPA